MNKTGGDGASLQTDREKLMDRAFPAGTRIITEQHIETSTKRLRVRVWRERIGRIDDATERSS